MRINPGFTKIIVSILSLVFDFHTSGYAQEQVPLLLQRTIQHYNKDQEKWKDSYKLLPVYDQKGSKIYESGYSFYRSDYLEDCDSTWLLDFDESWKYDENDILIMHERTAYDYSSDYSKEGCNIFTSYYLNREEYNYSREGLLNQEVLTNENKYEENEISGNITTINYMYDENNCLIETRTESISTYGDIYQQTTRYIRDINCNVLHQEGDNHKIEYIYNEAKQLIGIMNYSYNYQNGQWILIQEFNLEYWESGTIRKRIEKAYQNPTPQMIITTYDPEGHQVLKYYFSLNDDGFILDTLSTVITRWDDHDRVIYESNNDENSQFILTYDYIYNNNSQIIQEELSIQSSRRDSSYYSSYYHIVINEYDSEGKVITMNRVFSGFSHEIEYHYEISGETWEYYKYRCDGALEERLVDSWESRTYNNSDTYEYTNKFRELSYYSQALCTPQTDPIQVRAYPNPSSGLVNIESELLHQPGTTLVIYDSMGRKYFHNITTISQNGILDLRHLDPGLYIITLINPPLIASGKVIIRP